MIFLQTLTAHARSKSDAYGAKRIVGSGCDFSGAPGAVSIAIYEVVPRHGILVVTVDVITCLRILQQKLTTASLN